MWKAQQQQQMKANAGSTHQCQSSFAVPELFSTECLDQYRLCHTKVFVLDFHNHSTIARLQRPVFGI